MSGVLLNLKWDWVFGLRSTRWSFFDKWKAKNVHVVLYSGLVDSSDIFLFQLSYPFVCLNCCQPHLSPTFKVPGKYMYYSIFHKKQALIHIDRCTQKAHWLFWVISLFSRLWKKGKNINPICIAMSIDWEPPWSTLHFLALYLCFVDYPLQALPIPVSTEPFIDCDSLWNPHS